MDGSYRLKIKVGPHEFEAEGAPEDVRDQFQAFKEMISTMPSSVMPNTYAAAVPEQIKADPTPERSDVAINEVSLAKIMRSDGRTVSLTVRPKSLDDGILLILYGQKVLRQSDSVTGGEVLDGLKSTGGLVFGRIDRVMEKIGKDGDIIITGENRGKRYRMTNAGVSKARQLASDLLAIVA
jgi:hypothetical protein